MHLKSYVASPSFGTDLNIQAQVDADHGVSFHLSSSLVSVFTRMKERRPLVTRKLLVLLRCAPSFFRSVKREYSLIPCGIISFFFLFFSVVSSYSSPVSDSAFGVWVGV